MMALAPEAQAVEVCRAGPVMPSARVRWPAAMFGR